MLNARDNNHAVAARTYPRLLANYQRIVMTNFIVSETYTLVRGSLGHRQALAFLESTKASAKILVVMSSSELENQAVAILRQYDDHDFSYADAVSFAVMRLLGITDVFTYDHHFRALGFRMVGQ